MGGLFRRVVGTLIFIDDSDGMNGRMGFFILDAATGRKIFYAQAKRNYRMKKRELVWRARGCGLKGGRRARRC
jgi:hypothetical protein